MDFTTRKFKELYKDTEFSDVEFVIEYQKPKKQFQLKKLKKSLAKMKEEKKQSLHINEKKKKSKIKAQRKKFTAHRLVLSRVSPFFQKLFYPPNWQNNLSQIWSVVITDISPRSFEVILKYIYTQQIELNREICLQVLVASTKFEISNLIHYCEEYILKTCAVQNVLPTICESNFLKNKLVFDRSVYYLGLNYLKVFQIENCLNGMDQGLLIFILNYILSVHNKKVLKKARRKEEEEDEEEEEVEKEKEKEKIIKKEQQEGEKEKEEEENENEFNHLSEKRKYLFDRLFERGVYYCYTNLLTIHDFKTTFKNFLFPVFQLLNANFEQFYHLYSANQLLDQDFPNLRASKLQRTQIKKQKQKQKQNIEENKSFKGYKNNLQYNNNNFNQQINENSVLPKPNSPFQNFYKSRKNNENTRLEQNYMNTLPMEKNKMMFQSNTLVNKNFQIRCTNLKRQDNTTITGVRKRKPKREREQVEKNKEEELGSGAGEDTNREEQEIKKEKEIKKQQKKFRNDFGQKNNTFGNNGEHQFENQNQICNLNKEKQLLATNKIKILLMTTDQNQEHLDDVILSIRFKGISKVDYLDCSTTTPNFQFLKSYHAVFVYSTIEPFHDYEELGNVLADFVKGGGGLTLSTYRTMIEKPFKWKKSQLKGKICSDGYLPLKNGQLISLKRARLGAILLPNHPIIQGVENFDGGTKSYRIQSHFAIDKDSEGQLIALWSDGTPLIAWKRKKSQLGAGTVVLLNFQPVSGNCYQDRGRYSHWLNEDGRKIISNSIEWCLQNH
ncbi:pep-cterm sorting domain-containing protein [Anaeramoeba flamelloides]|uniref:Pep-cterm sorting domain-containing protein n=1 Tax=Anaeramoeba flamelloides TaxID=1746091 RepID=A0AAV7YBH5_9EUKA|nr:pep-cterm sorting domain-containing protein [Anaeramoeba flamelloides]